MSIYNKLANVQKQLKAPKGQYNSFGKYAYRSAEDILEAVKPLLADNGLALTLSDEVQEVGGRLYVKATAELFDCNSELSVDGKGMRIVPSAVRVTAYAREEYTKKGMDGAQITGSASSYARKYALNGLFAIDDTKDPDATNTHGKTAQSAPQKQPQQADPLQAAKVRLAKAIDAWAQRTGQDAEQTKRNVPNMPGFAQTIEFYNNAARQFEEANEQ